MNDKFGGHRPRPARLGWIGALLAILGIVALAACSSSSSSPSASASSPASTAYTKALSYSKCMRQHGVPSFPDPNSDGTFTQTGGSSGRPNVAPGILNAASSSCKALMPSSLQISTGQRQQLDADALKFAKCMRAHGVLNFPDPSGGGGEVTLPKGVDPNAPAYQAAQHACQGQIPQQQVAP